MLYDQQHLLRGNDQRINIRQEHEITYWIYELECTEEALLKAVRDVGPNISDVRERLEKSASLESRLPKVPER